jgi:hypothetical protein
LGIFYRPGDGSTLSLAAWDNVRIFLNYARSNATILQL